MLAGKLEAQVRGRSKQLGRIDDLRDTGLPVAIDFKESGGLRLHLAAVRGQVAWSG